jgi:hypothetical protein
MGWEGDRHEQVIVYANAAQRVSAEPSAARLTAVKADQGINLLQSLRAEAADSLILWDRGRDARESWRQRVISVLARSLGADSHLTRAMHEVSFTTHMVTAGPGDPEHQVAWRMGAETARGLIDAAIFELQTQELGAEEPDIDPAIWSKVESLVANEQWDLVPPIAVIAVESAIREWAGSPLDAQGRPLTIKGLLASVLGDASPLKLGKTAAESEGWRSLGVGFAQAVSNVDRHELQRRPDARRYARGVLGVASLIVGELRYQHPDLTDPGRGGAEDAAASGVGTEPPLRGPG